MELPEEEAVGNVTWHGLVAVNNKGLWLHKLAVTGQELCTQEMRQWSKWCEELLREFKMRLHSKHLFIVLIILDLMIL